MRQVQALREGIVRSTPRTAEAAEARQKSPVTLVLYEAEDRTLRRAREIAEGRGWEVGVLLFDEIFVRSAGRTEAEVEALAQSISAEVTKMWGVRVEMRAPKSAQERAPSSEVQ